MKKIEVYNKLKELFESKYIEHIYHIEGDNAYPVRLRYIEFDNGDYASTKSDEDKCIYFCGERMAKIPQRFSTYDFEKNNLFFDEIDALKYIERGLKRQLKSIQKHIGGEDLFSDCFKERKLKNGI